MRPGMGKGIPAKPGIALPRNTARELSVGAAAVDVVAVDVAAGAGGTR
jgi:hypothetical protein